MVAYAKLAHLSQRKSRYTCGMTLEGPRRLYCQSFLLLVLLPVVAVCGQLLVVELFIAPVALRGGYSSLAQAFRGFVFLTLFTVPTLLGLAVLYRIEHSTFAYVCFVLGVVVTPILAVFFALSLHGGIADW